MRRNLTCHACWRPCVGAWLLAWAIAASAHAVNSAAPEPPVPVLQVIYPDIEERGVDDYGYRVLRLALDKSAVSYQLRRTARTMNQQRARMLLEQGAISIFETGTSADFEARYDAVYFPVDRGLSGYRLLLIHRDNAAVFGHVDSGPALAKWSAGQGPGWADIAILEGAGIHVYAAEFAALPKLLQARRIDFYPLGVEEIGGILARNKAQAPDLLIEPHLALHYDFARLFFVRKGDYRLRDAVLLGLTRAFDDGSLQRLLESDAGFRRSLAAAAIKRRRVIEMANPNLTDAFRQMPRKYFYTLD